MSAAAQRAISRRLSTAEDAYAHCERSRARQAANFYYGIRLLPRERRRAMCAVYAFARRVDDIGDGALERSREAAPARRRGAALAELQWPATASAAARRDPVMVALADAHARFALPLDALGS